MKKSETRLSPEANARLVIVVARAGEFIKAAVEIEPDKLEALTTHNRQLIPAAVSDEQVRQGTESHAREQIRLSRIMLERTIKTAKIELKRN